MAQVYRYLGFVEHGDNLPKGVKLNLSLLLNEICGTEYILKALKWAQKQQDWQGINNLAEAFFQNYLVAGNPLDHVPTLIVCLDVFPDFGSHLSREVHDDMFDKLGDHNIHDISELLRSASLVGELYSLEVTEQEEIFALFCRIVDSKMTNTNRIEMFKKILLYASTIKFIIEKDVDQRFWSFVGMMKARTEIYGQKGSATPEEIEQLIRALVDLNLYSQKTRKYDKTEKIERAIVSWCKGESNLEETLANFAAIDVKYLEELGFCASQMFRLSMDDIDYQEKLVNLQVHLRFNTFKHKQQLFDKAWKLTLGETVDGCFYTANLLTNIMLVRYLSGLYMHNVIDCSVIVRSLENFMTRPDDITNPSFTAIFTTVEDKLKKDVDDKQIKAFTNHLVKKIINGHEKSPDLPPACEVWLAKKEKERRAAVAEKEDGKPKVATEIKTSRPKSSEEAVEDYCNGTRSLSLTLKYFNYPKPYSEQFSGSIVRLTLNFALSRADCHEKLAVLLKHLCSGDFNDLECFLFKHLRKTMREYYEDTVSPLKRERNLSFVNYISQLFVMDVIDPVLIGESLQTFLMDSSDTSDACFAAMFTKVETIIQRQITEEKFKEFKEHLESYIIPNHMYEVEMPPELRQYVERKGMKLDNARPDAKELPKKKKSPGTKGKDPKVAKKGASSEKRKSPDKLKEIVEKLQKILNSEGRMKIFIKHILEHPSSDLKGILVHSKLLVALAEASNEAFNFKDWLINTILSEFLSYTLDDSEENALAKLNRIEIISCELWRNNLMATMSFTAMLTSKNSRSLPVESLTYLSMIIANAKPNEDNSKLKAAAKKFEAFIHDSTNEELSSLDADDLQDEIQKQLLKAEEKEANRSSSPDCWCEQLTGPNVFHLH